MKASDARPDVRTEPRATCPGCEARQAEIEYLRVRLAAKDDQLLALVNPAALAQVRGTPEPLTGHARVVPETVVGQGGKLFVNVQGRAIPAEEYERMMAAAGYLDGEGNLVSPEEYARGMSKLDELMNGGTSARGRQHA